MSRPLWKKAKNSSGLKRSSKNSKRRQNKHKKNRSRKKSKMRIRLIRLTLQMTLLKQMTTTQLKSHPKMLELKEKERLKKAKNS